MTTGAQQEPAFVDAMPMPSGLLPLVSVIVVNYNYDRFLEEAIESVFRQTWPRVECVVVDNGSSDGSAAVIDACVARHPSLMVHRRTDNGGQTTASLEGIARTHGPYVIFLDADDYLLPHCVATHMAVHLSSRVHVGFTSGEMLQIVDGQVVLSTNEAMSTFHEKPARQAPKHKRRTELLRPAAILGSLAAPAATLAGRVHLVPRTEKDWVWAPTSGNCFRRDALTLLCDGDGLASLKSQTDLYLALAVNAVSGSLIIDEPLFAYRLHGTNSFSSRAQLQGFLSYDSKRSSGQAAMARRLIIDQLTRHAERFVQEPWMRWSFFATLRRLDSRVETGRWRGGSYAAFAVASHFASVAEAVGRDAAFVFVLKGAPWRLKLTMLLARRPVTA